MRGGAGSVASVAKSMNAGEETKEGKNVAEPRESSKVQRSVVEGRPTGSKFGLGWMCYSVRDSAGLHLFWRIKEMRPTQSA